MARQRFAAAKQFRKKAPAPGLALTDETRRWIAENLMLGAPPQTISSRLHSLGCPPALAAAEIEQALQSPYYQGVAVLQQRLAKREWLLSSYARLAALDGGLGAVPVIDRLPAEAFFRNYYATNKPVLIEGLMADWPAIELWSLDYFDEALGDTEIQVQVNRQLNPNYESEANKHRRLMPMRQVTEMLRNRGETNDFYVTAGNSDHNAAAMARLYEDVGPIDGYLASGGEKKGFIWIGPKGTITPFHHDLTNNLLVQLRGRKRVTMVPGWQTSLMKNHKHCFSGWNSPDEIAALPDGERPSMLPCTIEPGQALFIPVGWWHHVVGLDMTIGMSFTAFARDNDFYSNYSFYNQV